RAQDDRLGRQGDPKGRFRTNGGLRTGEAHSLPVATQIFRLKGPSDPSCTSFFLPLPGVAVARAVRLAVVRFSVMFSTSASVGTLAVVLAEVFAAAFLAGVFAAAFTGALARAAGLGWASALGTSATQSA